MSLGIIATSLPGAFNHGVFGGAALRPALIVSWFLTRSSFLVFVLSLLAGFFISGFFHWIDKWQIFIDLSLDDFDFDFVVLLLGQFFVQWGFSLVQNVFVCVILEE